MTKDSVVVGALFVSDRMQYVREVIVIEDELVHYQVYELTDGSPADQFRACSRNQMLKWSDRLATPAEAARMQLRKKHPNELAREELVKGLALLTASDAELENELARRRNKRQDS